MEKTTYTLERPVGTFEEGEVLRVTARFGEQYLHDLRLEPVNSHASGSVILTEEKLERTAAVSDSTVDPIPTQTRVP